MIGDSVFKVLKNDSETAFANFLNKFAEDPDIDVHGSLSSE